MRNEKGFSILEVLVVMTIIGILTSIVIPELFNAKIRAQVSAVSAESKSLLTGFKQYYLDWGAYPNSSLTPAFDLVTFDPVRSAGFYHGRMTNLLLNERADAYDSPDDAGSNQEFWLEMTLQSDPSVRFVVADSNDAPLSGGAILDGVYVYRDGTLVPQ